MGQLASVPDYRSHSEEEVCSLGGCIQLASSLYFLQGLFQL